jgi:hypothetical protein
MLRPPDRQHPRRADIVGKIAVGRDRLRVYEDIVLRNPTERMLESAHTEIADGLVYTIEATMISISRTAASNPAALSVVYPLVQQAARFPIPSEAILRAILANWPSEGRLREIIDARRRSVHAYTSVEYVTPDVVAAAHQGVLAFWTATTIAIFPIVGATGIPGAFEGRGEAPSSPEGIT